MGINLIGLRSGARLCLNDMKTVDCNVLRLVSVCPRACPDEKSTEGLLVSSSGPEDSWHDLFHLPQLFTFLNLVNRINRNGGHCVRQTAQLLLRPRKCHRQYISLSHSYVDEDMEVR